MIDFNFRCRNRKALTIIETVVSLTILLIVLLTYASSNQAKKSILKALTHQTFYNRLANVQLERVMNFIHNNKQLSKDFYSTNKSDVATGDFKSFTEVFSFEGINGKLDEYDAVSTPNIPLYQLEVRGTDIGDNDYHNGGEDRRRFLAFPYPNELKSKSVYDPSALWTDPHSQSGTLHHITPKLNEDDGGQRKYRGVLPLVSEEFVTINDDGTRNELGFEGGSALAAEDVQLSAGTSLFLDPSSIGTWENERIRRYVYYRKIREGNIVFRSNVRGKGTSQAEGDTAHADQTKNTLVTTDIENLYIQSLNDWNAADGSSNGGEVLGIEGTAYPGDVGAVGAHSIYIMVVVRAIDLDEIDDTTPVSINDVDFLNQSEIKAVACGIATPTYGKNLLKSIELSYHRYSFSRIPGTKIYRQ